jgi:AcrR family transcriptional regulator
MQNMISPPSPAPDLPVPLSQKGAKKQAELLSAALRIIARDGHHHLTLRNVAGEAKSSHGSVNYYFGSRDALMSAAMEYAGAYIAETSAEIIPDLEKAAARPKKFAEIIARYNIDMLINNRSMGIVVFELNLAAAREEYLRPILYKWGKIHSELYRDAFSKLGSKDPSADYSFMLHTVNGLLVAQLSLPRSDFETKILRPAIERLSLSIASS